MTEIYGPTVTAYIFSLVPLDHSFVRLWSCRVEWRGNDRWSVTHNGDVLNRNCENDHGGEPQPSSRTQEYLDEYRFSEEEALEIARKYTPTITVNDSTLQDFINKWPDYMDWKN